jgi:predicted RNA-binding Zn ribbon-like protein
MKTTRQDPGHTAPGELEQVRTFVNTWSIPNDSRAPADELPALFRNPASWARAFSGGARQRTDTLTTLLRLRDDLRAALSHDTQSAERLQAWFDRASPVIELRAGRSGLALAHRAKDRSFVARTMATVAQAIASGKWLRLKTCPDCQWAFYDHTRNGSKRWCGMTKGGPQGRACGTIAKVSAFRERAREAEKQLRRLARTARRPSAR